jgi:hypothetical protein
MVKKSALVQTFIDTVKETVFYNIERLSQLRYRDYPFKASEDFVGVLSKIHEGLLAILGALELEVSEKAEKDEPIPEDVLIRIKRCGQLVGVLHSVLKVLEMGNREYISQGSVVLMESITKQFGSDSRFILLPMYEYNFTYQDLIQPLKTMLKDVLPHIEEILSPFAKKFAVIGFPLVQRENILLNSLLAHEVGHSINEENLIVENLMGKVSIDIKKVDEITKEWSRWPGEKTEVTLTSFIEFAALKAEVHKMATRWISNWLKELVSDVLAFHLVGPAYLFALTNFLLTLTGVDGESSDYPPPRMRIKLMLDEFDEMGYPKTLRSIKTEDNTIKEIAIKFLKIAEDTNVFLSEIEEEEKDKFAILIHDSVTRVIPELRKTINDIIGPNEYTPREFSKDVFPLILSLDSFVPPAEISAEKPAAPISILNAGMLYEMLLMENLYKTLEASTPTDKLYARHKLHQLTLKALELSSIQSSMKKAMKRRRVVK